MNETIGNTNISMTELPGGKFVVATSGEINGHKRIVGWAGSRRSRAVSEYDLRRRSLFNYTNGHSDD